MWNWIVGVFRKVWNLGSAAPKAIERADGTRFWFQNDQLHRTDGPAVEYADGARYWYQNGQLHRTDGPAYEGASGHREWWLNGQRHRVDGPAIEWADGHRYWFLNGQHMSQSEWFEAVALYNWVRQRETV